MRWSSSLVGFLVKSALATWDDNIVVAEDAVTSAIFLKISRRDWVIFASLELKREVDVRLSAENVLGTKALLDAMTGENAIKDFTRTILMQYVYVILLSFHLG